MAPPGRNPAREFRWAAMVGGRRKSCRWRQARQARGRSPAGCRRSCQLQAPECDAPRHCDRGPRNLSFQPIAEGTCWHGAGAPRKISASPLTNLPQRRKWTFLAGRPIRNKPAIAAIASITVQSTATPSRRLRGAVSLRGFGAGTIARSLINMDATEQGGACSSATVDLAGSSAVIFLP
jgi:hypothetical protein